MCVIYLLHKQNKNAQVDDAHDINVGMPMYNSIECSDNYSKTSILWQYYIDEAARNAANCNIDNFKQIMLLFICLK